MLGLVDQPLAVFLGGSCAISLLKRHGAAVARLDDAIRADDGGAAVGARGAPQAVRVDLAGRLLHPSDGAVATAVAGLDDLRIVRIQVAIDVVRGDQLVGLDHGESGFHLGALGGLDGVGLAFRHQHLRLDGLDVGLRRGDALRFSHERIERATQIIAADCRPVVAEQDAPAIVL
ncbi:hypothetical protein D9M69_478720 [compost metagenome]